MRRQLTRHPSVEPFLNLVYPISDGSSQFREKDNAGFHPRRGMPGRASGSRRGGGAVTKPMVNAAG
jgi:hypothetical protein